MVSFVALIYCCLRGIQIADSGLTHSGAYVCKLITTLQLEVCQWQDIAPRQLKLTTAIGYNDCPSTAAVTHDTNI